MPCQFCKFECFVRLPKDTPKTIARIFKSDPFWASTYNSALMTCRGGQEMDFELFGHNYGTIMREIRTQTSDKPDGTFRCLACNKTFVARRF